MLVREVILRCKNCNCGVKVEESKLGSNTSPVVCTRMSRSWDADDADALLFTVVKNRKKEP